MVWGAGWLAAQAPVITRQPQGANAYDGMPATFSVEASGTNLNYRWLWNGFEMGFPNAPSLVLSDVVPDAAGLYSVEVHNGSGSVTSDPARLTVLAPGVDSLWQGRPWVRILGTGDQVPGSGSTFGPLKAPFNPLFALRDRSLQVVARADGEVANPAVPRTALVRWDQGMLSTLVFTNTPLPGGGGHFVYPYYPTEEGAGVVNFQQGDIMYALAPGGVSEVLTGTTPVPGRPGSTFGGSGSFARRGAGVVLSTMLRHGGGMADTTGLYYLEAGGLVKIADDLTDLPGVMAGYAFRLTEDSVNFDGSTIVFSTMTSVGGMGGVYKATKDGVVTKLLDTGDLLPGLTNAVVSFGDVDVEGGVVFAVVGTQRQGVTQNRVVMFEADGSAQPIGFGDYLAASGPRQVYFGTSGSVQRWTDGVTETVLNTQALLGRQQVKWFLDVEAQGNDVVLSVEYANGTGALYANWGEATQGTPRILNGPGPLTAPETSTAALSVSATGPPPLQYQWYKGEAQLQGATQAVHTIWRTSPADAGSYHVVVTAGGSSVESEPSTLSVGPVPLRPLMFVPPSSVSVPVGSPALLRTWVAGLGPLNYVWRKGAMVVAEGAVEELSFASVTPADHGTYTVSVTNANGAAPTWSATLSVTPLITQAPQSQTVTQGGTAEFSVTATGYPAMRYQWFKGTAVMIGQTNQTLTLTNVQPADAGSYSVNVSGVGGGGLRSAAAALTVLDGGSGPQAPELQAAAVVGGRLEFTLQTQTGVTYDVEFKTALSDAAWTVLQSLVGDGQSRPIGVDLVGGVGFVRLAARKPLSIGPGNPCERDASSTAPGSQPGHTRRLHCEPFKAAGLARATP